ncbi:MULTISPECIES: hypothetical protein [Sandaracinus]|uniref:hypothetical protein n=1 Tax=Sandaracinus TaxID=1055688 RepID=UPI0019D488FD|nr:MULTISPECIES: hypothetical protein [Sandaracinus]QRN75778.1 Hypothetical protein MSR10575_88650 [Sandaracinus sp.]UJR87292.1 Hypothetical protein I5071_840 [Sandaracinus amylolyticus]
MRWLVVAVALAGVGCGASSGPGAAVPRTRALDAGIDAGLDAGPSDAGAVESAVDATSNAGSAGRSAQYVVVLSERREAVRVDRDPECSERQASCAPSDCFRIDAFVPRTAAPAALERCARDAECTAAYTVCCGREAVDVRALRGDSVDRWRQRLCGEPRTCAEDAAVLATLNVACVEARCRLVEEAPEAFCAEPDADFRVIVPGARPRLVSHPRDPSCLLGTPFCDPENDCLAIADLGPPRPSPDMTWCSRDADCVVDSRSCCDCGATEFRPMRRDAVGRWRRCPRIVACPECVDPHPMLLPACIEGVCRALEVRDESECEAVSSP